MVEQYKGKLQKKLEANLLEQKKEIDDHLKDILLKEEETRALIESVDEV